MDEPVRPREMRTLTSLPPEILHNILQWLLPADIAILPRVCSFLRSTVQGNSTLCRHVYLNHFDTPKDLNLNWEREILDVARLQAICHRGDVAEKKYELDFVYDVVNRLLEHASPSHCPSQPTCTHAISLNTSLLADLFRHDSNHEAFFERSFLFERVRSEVRHPIRASEGGPSKAALRQRSAKLHCLYGRPILNVGPLRSGRTYPYACSKVYDLRQYTQRTHWGPFLDDGSDRVDWEKVEAILIVLAHNIGSRRSGSRVFRDVWDNPFSGSWSGSYVAPPAPDMTPLEARDPYDVTGSWYRIVCFLDYNDLFSYNFPAGDLGDTDPDTPRPALDVGEASRIIIMQIHVTKIERAGPDDGQDMPVVHFRGISRSLDDSFDDNGNSHIRGLAMKGTVRMTREGEVRWTTFSIFNGQERWRSEGVQLGGVRSSRGVVGNWFDRDYDVHGPAGPTAFWKASSRGQIHRLEDALLPSEFLVQYGALGLELDEEEDEDEDEDEEGPEEDEEGDEEEDDDDGEEETEEIDISNELPGLLTDAERDVMDVLTTT
ncbi:hypothetical protein QQZ08_010181 [Neonectria magnoliae]|uniref:F-box domain-containing protein n=1 Tax=Neonectria magnoliae TaxID=2732573 RepID=A0ABR1HI57_9HYPO